MFQPVYEDEPPVSELQTVWLVDGCLVRDNTSHVMRREGYPPEAVAEALDARFVAVIAESSLATATCPECERVFDLLDEDDSNEWYFGHDCEAAS